jgi:hypothetical protein
VNLDHARLPLHSDERVTYSKFISILLLPLALNWQFWWGNEVSGPRLIPFWCLMPKGEKIRPKQQMDKIRPKQQMDQLPLENSRIELFGLSKISYCLFCQKLASCGENEWLWEKGGVFEIFDQFLLEQLSLCLNKCVWFRDRKLRLICKNKPSGGKGWSIYAKSDSKQICVLIRIDVVLLLVALCCVGINHQKGEDWKGNVPLGHF